MDHQTREQIAEFICGDSKAYPIYRTGGDLTEFFERVGFSNLKHDGSTRKKWVLEILKALSINNLNAVILRLANPREYRGDAVTIQTAITELNRILMIEGRKVELDGVTPSIKEIKPDFNPKPKRDEGERELKPLSPPDFSKLSIEPGLATILTNRWAETQRCVDSNSFLSGIILMGSMLEGLMLAACQKHPQEANQCPLAPKNVQTGKPKYFAEWSLSEMINVGHELGWIDLDVKKFSHALRDFRNLIHPYQQMVTNANPDKDTCTISWLVVQAAINDVSRILK